MTHLTQMTHLCAHVRVAAADDGWSRTSRRLGSLDPLRGRIGDVPVPNGGDDRHRRGQCGDIAVPELEEPVR